MIKTYHILEIDYTAHGKTERKLWAGIGYIVTHAEGGDYINHCFKRQNPKDELLLSAYARFEKDGLNPKIITVHV